MANPQNLVSLATRPQQERHAIALKGGKTCSIRKRLASQLREMRKKGLNSAQCERFVQLMASPELSALEILKYTEVLMGLARQEKTVQALNIAISKLNEWHKMWHGDKGASNTYVQNNTQDNSKNITINIIMPEDSQNEIKNLP